MSKIIYKHPDELVPHLLNYQLYGPPSQNSAYYDIKADMKRRGYDESKPLLITEDGRVICGVTRHAVAKSLRLDNIPCVLFKPDDPLHAELEIERALVRDNTYRIKTELMKAREQRRLLQVESALARGRMASGSDGGPSMSTDRVGKIFGESGKTVQRRLKVLDAIEQAEAGGDTKHAQRLGELLNTKQITKALALLDPDRVKRKKERLPKVANDEERTLLDHVTSAYSELESACHLAETVADVVTIEDFLERMQRTVAAKRARLTPPEGSHV
jgi:ParB-like chromosome segregation protein Spo0J